MTRTREDSTLAVKLLGTCAFRGRVIFEQLDVRNWSVLAP